MDTSGKSLIEHWNWAAKKGVMNANSAASLRTACVQVLSALGAPETVDVKDLDVDDALTRFQNLKKKDFKPAVLETYKRRFKAAIASYLAYLDDPGGWKPRSAERPPERERSKNTDREVAKTPAAQVTRQEMPQAGLVEYPFPIREGQIARLVLPRDLKATEVKRLFAFMSTLAVDFTPDE